MHQEEKTVKKNI